MTDQEATETKDIWVYGWVTSAGVRYRAKQYQGRPGFHLPGDVWRAARVYSENVELRCGSKVAATFEAGQWL